MKSKSKPGPATQKSRRAFIQKIGTAAAASGLAATCQLRPANAGQLRPAPGGARIAGGGLSAGKQLYSAARPRAQSSRCRRFALGKHEVSRLWLGVNGIGTHYSGPLSPDVFASGTHPNS